VLRPRRSPHREYRRVGPRNDAAALSSKPPHAAAVCP
jgi:hypothetical protein